MLRLNSKPADEKDIGYFVTFAHSEDDKIHVDTDGADRFRIQITISFPDSKMFGKCVFFSAILRRLYAGGLIPIRMDYSNVSEFFSMEELAYIERNCNYFSFHVCNVPMAQMPNQESSNLNIQKVINKIRREQKREARLRLLTQTK